MRILLLTINTFIIKEGTHKPFPIVVFLFAECIFLDKLYLLQYWQIYNTIGAIK
jgi:hypothetical protein